jgi:dephospho-CoA kinase
MKVLGITGGMGSGKSIVCKIFQQLLIPVFEADAEVKKMYSGKKELLESLRKKFPAQLFAKDGSPDTSGFAAWFFEKPEELAALNSIVHPFVKERFTEWARPLRTPYVILEAAILFESGTDKQCDKVASVEAPEDLRIKRVRLRDDRSKEEIVNILQRQGSDEWRRQQSDFVIVNDEQQLVLPQVLQVHRQMLKLSGGEK